MCTFKKIEKTPRKDREENEDEDDNRIVLGCKISLKD
jgi:hypothetical protein